MQRLINEKSIYCRERIAIELKKHHKLTVKDVKPFFDDFYIVVNEANTTESQSHKKCCGNFCGCIAL